MTPFDKGFAKVDPGWIVLSDMILFCGERPWPAWMASLCIDLDFDSRRLVSIKYYRELFRWHSARVATVLEKKGFAISSKANRKGFIVPIGSQASSQASSQANSHIKQQEINELAHEGSHTSSQASSQASSHHYQTTDYRLQKEEGEEGEGAHPAPCAPAEKPKKNGVEYPDWVNRELFAEWAAMRKAKKTPLATPRAYSMAFAKLQKLMALGHSQDELLEEAIFRGWLSFYPPKNDLDTKPQGKFRKPTLQESAQDTMRQLELSGWLDT